MTHFFLSNHLIRKISFVSFGSFGAHIVNIVSLPIIVRLFSTEDIAILGYFIASCSVLIPMMSFSYQRAQVLPDKDLEANDLCMLTYLISIIMGMLIFMLFFAYHDLIIEALNLKEIEGVILFIPIGAMIMVWLDIVKYRVVREEAFLKAAKITVIISIVVNILKVLLGLNIPTYLSLVIITIFGYSLHYFLLQKITSFSFTLMSDFNFKRIIDQAKKNINFLKYTTPQNILNAVSTSFPVFLLASLYSLELVGYYVIAKTMVSVPSAMVGKAMLDVFYVDFSRVKKNNLLITQTIINRTVILFKILIIPLIIFFFASPWLFSLLFGDSWEASGEIAKYLSIMYFFSLLYRPALAVIPVLGLQKGLLIYEMVSTIGRVLGLLFGYYYFDNIMASIVLFSTVGAVGYLSLFLWTISKSKNKGYI